MALFTRDRIAEAVSLALVAMLVAMSSASSAEAATTPPAARSP